MAFEIVVNNTSMIGIPNVLTRRLNNIIREELRNLPDFKQKVSLYNVGAAHSHSFNEENNSLFIFSYATTNKQDQPVKGFGSLKAYGKDIISDIYFPPTNGSDLITDESGNLIGEVMIERSIVNIFFDLFNLKNNAEDVYHVFRNIIQEVNKRIATSAQRLSWKHGNIEMLKANLAEVTNRDNERIVRDLERQVENLTSQVKEYQIGLTRLVRNQLAKMAELERAKKNENNLTEKMLKDIEAILSLPDVKDFYFRDGRAKVLTNRIDFYYNDERYEGTEYSIEFDFINNDIKFFAENRISGFRGYWGNLQPHPHISHSGNACLGNASDSLAMLAGNNELYAYVMVAIEFLKSVNPSDPAGAYYQNWPLLDKFGNRITDGNDDESAEPEDEYEEEGDEE